MTIEIKVKKSAIGFIIELYSNYSIWSQLLNEARTFFERKMLE